MTGLQSLQSVMLSRSGSCVTLADSIYQVVATVDHWLTLALASEATVVCLCEQFCTELWIVHQHVCHMVQCAGRYPLSNRHHLSCGDCLGAKREDYKDC